ncbi:MAG: DUF167 domain-containing protein [Thermoguttaceae bacterium]|nr:DUF167 domain-containing protein [Thermoguttaceae bacterium]
MSKFKSKGRADDFAASQPSSDAPDALLLETRAEGVVLPVKAQPGSGRNELRGLQDGALKVCVTQIAEKGKANKAIVEFLAKALKLRKSQIELCSGELSSQKKFLIKEIGEAELRAKIEAAI